MEKLKNKPKKITVERVLEIADAVAYVCSTNNVEKLDLFATNVFKAALAAETGVVGVCNDQPSANQMIQTFEEQN